MILVPMMVAKVETVPSAVAVEEVETVPLVKEELEVQVGYLAVAVAVARARPLAEVALEEKMVALEGRSILMGRTV